MLSVLSANALKDVSGQLVSHKGKAPITLSGCLTISQLVSPEFLTFELPGSAGFIPSASHWQQR
jgi:hypothetical protein